MRRLLLLAVLAAGTAGLTSSASAENCTGSVARIRVCYQVKACGACPIDPYVDPQCEPQQPFTNACVAIDNLYVDLGPR